jgi:hypothetical protein
VFVNEIMINRKPGGNGAHSDTAATPEELVTIISVLQGTDGWAQLIGEGKFMSINGSGGMFAVTVGVQEQPPKRFTMGKVDLPRAIEAAKAFAEDGRMDARFTWTAEALRPKPVKIGAPPNSNQNKIKKAS